MLPLIHGEIMIARLPSDGREGKGELLFQLRQAFHQAALAAGGIVLVDHAFVSRTVEHADRHLHGLNGLFARASSDVGAGFLHESAGAATEDAVLHAAFFVLLIALNRGFNVCQSFLRYL